ncbi:hypothetical protein Btru_039205 [Bulinus truncatus]|nr:hypothetical protein Btru_039205 [Bulinus truncatus]
MGDTCLVLALKGDTRLILALMGDTCLILALISDTCLVLALMGDTCLILALMSDTCLVLDGRDISCTGLGGRHISCNSFEDPCHIDEAHHCNVCRHASVEYFNKYSPLHVYRPRNDTSSLVKMKDSTTFETLTSGSYLLHLDIVMIDEDQNHSIGIFVNKKTVLACPRGGFLLPQDKADILKYRICNIDGLVTLKAGDNLQIRTMDAHTTVRLEPTQVSLFKFILLHKMTANSPNKS